MSNLKATKLETLRFGTLVAAAALLALASVAAVALLTSTARPGAMLSAALLEPLALARDLHANASEEDLLVTVFGDETVDQIEALPQERFPGAKARALDLAYRVKDRRLTTKDARELLTTTLKRMDRGQPLDDLPDPSFEVVGKMPVGLTPSEQAKAEAATAMQKYSVSAIKKTPPHSTRPAESPAVDSGLDPELDRQ